MCEVICITCKGDIDIEDEEAVYCEGCHEQGIDDRADSLAEERLYHGEDPYYYQKLHMHELLARVIETDPSDAFAWKWLKADIEDGLRLDFYPDTGIDFGHPVAVLPEPAPATVTKDKVLRTLGGDA